jgi:hypothetical protein
VTQAETGSISKKKTLINIWRQTWLRHFSACVLRKEEREREIKSNEI